MQDEKKWPYYPSCLTEVIKKELIEILLSGTSFLSRRNFWNSGSISFMSFVNFAIFYPPYFLSILP